MVGLLSSRTSRLGLKILLEASFQDNWAKPLLKRVFILLSRLRFTAFFLSFHLNMQVFIELTFSHITVQTQRRVFFPMQKNIINSIIIVGTVHSEGLLHVYVCYRMCSQFSLAGYTIEIIKRVNLSQLPNLRRRCLCFVRVANTLYKKNRYNSK